MRIQDDQDARLQKMARRLGRSPSETSALLVEEGLRRSEFAFIEFRDSPVGRQAYVQGSRLAVWQVVSLARGYKNSVGETAQHLTWPPIKVQAALKYARAFPEEIGLAIKDNSSQTFETLSALLPNLESFGVKKVK